MQAPLYWRIYGYISRRMALSMFKGRALYYKRAKGDKIKQKGLYTQYPIKEG